MAAKAGLSVLFPTSNGEVHRRQRTQIMLILLRVAEELPRRQGQPWRVADMPQPRQAIPPVAPETVAHGVGVDQHGLGHLL